MTHVKQNSAKTATKRERRDMYTQTWNSQAPTCVPAQVRIEFGHSGDYLCEIEGMYGSVPSRQVWLLQLVTPAHVCAIRQVQFYEGLVKSINELFVPPNRSVLCCHFLGRVKQIDDHQVGFVILCLLSTQGYINEKSSNRIIQNWSYPWLCRSEPLFSLYHWHDSTGEYKLKDFISELCTGRPTRCPRLHARYVHPYSRHPVMFQKQNMTFQHPEKGPVKSCLSGHEYQVEALSSVTRAILKSNLQRESSHVSTGSLTSAKGPVVIVTVQRLNKTCSWIPPVNKSTTLACVFSDGEKWSFAMSHWKKRGAGCLRGFVLNKGFQCFMSFLKLLCLPAFKIHTYSSYKA